MFYADYFMLIVVRPINFITIDQLKGMYHPFRLFLSGREVAAGVGIEPSTIPYGTVDNQPLFSTM